MIVLNISMSYSFIFFFFPKGVLFHLFDIPKISRYVVMFYSKWWKSDGDPPNLTTFMCVPLHIITVYITKYCSLLSYMSIWTGLATVSFHLWGAAFQMYRYWLWLLLLFLSESSICNAEDFFFFWLHSFWVMSLDSLHINTKSLVSVLLSKN